MRSSLLAATCLLGLAAAAPAHALLVSTVSGTGLAAGACDTNDGGAGSLVAVCSGGSFAAIIIAASGPPLLNAPDLTSTALTVTTNGGGPATLDIVIDSSGFNFPGGPVTALFTVNSLIGDGIGPYTLEASAPGVGTLTHVFNGSGSESDGPTVLAPFTSDQVHFNLTFSGVGIESVDATIELVGVAAVPEPVTLGVLGVGLLGLGLVRWSRSAGAQAA